MQLLCSIKRKSLVYYYDHKLTQYHDPAQVGLLNVDGYYNFLLALFDNGVKEGFIKPGARNIVVSASSAKELMKEMEVYD